MKLALVGYGRMGRAVEDVALQKGHQIMARIDPVLESKEITRETLNGAEVAIEFSVPGAVTHNIGTLAKAGVDVVVGTTGWSSELRIAAAAVAASGTGLIHSPNFSLGVHVFVRLAQHAGRLANALEEYDVHVWEAHHRHKLDHPSGTAIHVADRLIEELGRKVRWAEAPPGGAPDPQVLYVASQRAGETPGTHVVGIEGPDDRIELRHEARGRTGFARGAVAAAEWIRGRSGVFTLDDMLAERFG